MAMNSGKLICLCLAALFAAVVLPWSFAGAYRRHHTSNAPTKPKKIVENANSYRRYREYTVLILCWAVVIMVYIAVIDAAVKDPAFLGSKGSKSRNTNVEVLSFLTTGLAVVHLPLMTTVLASTVPYLTMAKFDRRSASGTSTPPPADALHGFQRPPTKVTKLFYLADKTWAGLIGWIMTSTQGYKEGGLSYTWAMLTIIAALSYVGFPLLSLAYVSTSTQYWESGSITATVRVGGLNSSYNSLLEAMQNPDLWMRSAAMFNATIESNLSGINSSSADAIPYSGRGNQSAAFPWANDRTMLTVPPNTAENKQLPLAGVRAFASCKMNTYSSRVEGSRMFLPHIPNLELDDAGSDPNDGLSYKWRCGFNCSDISNSSVPACRTQSSTVNLTRFDYKDETDDQAGYTNSYTRFYSFDNAGPTYPGQALSCIRQDFTDLSSVATVALAISDFNGTTQVAECNLSVTYLRPTVNTLIRSYIDSTSSTSSPDTDIVLDASPVELLNLSMSSFIDFFHRGPAPLTYQPAKGYEEDCTLPPITNGFDWVSEWKPPCGTDTMSRYYEGTLNHPNATTPELLLNVFGSLVERVSPFDERVFLGPLASLINDPSFFQNGTVAGVTFQTEQGLAYGKVSAPLAIIILALPILCTIALSSIAMVQRRWTASLDAFAMFKLGADWHSSVANQKLVTLGKASTSVKDIPGTVMVNPETGVVALAHAPKKRRLSDKSRRPGWLMDYMVVDPFVPQWQRAVDEQQPVQQPKVSD